jgi:hypothetical protein
MMASSSLTATSALADSNLAPPPGRSGWEGSEVTPTDIEWITNTRRVPPEVSCQLPTDKTVPAPEANERVVFIAHFERGFALPVSDFFWDFLDYYEL